MKETKRKWPSFETWDIKDLPEFDEIMQKRWEIYDREMKALIAKGGVHEDEDGWWVDDATGELIAPILKSSGPSRRRSLRMQSHSPKSSPSSPPRSSAPAAGRNRKIPRRPSPCGSIPRPWRASRPRAPTGGGAWRKSSTAPRPDRAALRQNC